MQLLDSGMQWYAIQTVKLQFQLFQPYDPIQRNTFRFTTKKYKELTFKLTVVQYVNNSLSSIKL